MCPQRFTRALCAVQAALTRRPTLNGTANHGPVTHLLKFIRRHVCAQRARCSSILSVLQPPL